MDLHFTQDRPTAAEQAVVDSVLGPPRSAWEGGIRSERDLHVATPPTIPRDRLLPTLQALQHQIGYLSRGAMNYVAERLHLPPAEVYGVASFYALLALESAPPYTLHVCDDLACLLQGGEALAAELEAQLAAQDGMPMRVLRSPCLGHCARAPAIFVQRAGGELDDVVLAPVSSWNTLLSRIERGEVPPPEADAVPQKGSADTRLLRHIGRIDPTDIDSYRAVGGYEALRIALSLGPEGVIREVKESGLQGRGGAAFPTGAKWEAVARNPNSPHFVVLNADESEPGTFKDRVLLEENPFAVLEGLTIAAYACGAEKGYIFLRGEYPKARRRLEEAIAQAARRGFIGSNILGRGVHFDVELRSGAGAYICGEETALFNSIEGRRGEPRNKPPFPTVRGLFGKPTVVNNVETLANIPWILREGGRAFASVGSPDAAGTRLFSVSGDVVQPGLYEVPFGTELRTLLELAGGVKEHRRLKAVLLGGAAGSFVGPEALAMPLSPAGARAFGATLGSGVVVVFDETRDLRPIVLRIARFFRDESCGQCVPCRVGTVRQEELLRRLLAGRPNGSWEAELQLFRDLAQAMRDASICGLGQTAANAVESALRLGFFDEGGTPI